MCIFACSRASPLEKALYYVSMQVLVDRKLKNDLDFFDIFRSDENLKVIFLGRNVTNLKMIEKALRMVPGSSRAM